MKSFFKFVIAILLPEFVGSVSAFFTVSSISNWYQFLRKPAFSPPNYIFGPVWTMLYLFMGISFYLIWIKGWKNQKVKKALTFFFIQLTFNFVWSLLFFGLRFPLLGLIDIIILWVMILLTIMKFQKISKIASYFMIPYLLWVTFASLLNLSIVILNR